MYKTDSWERLMKRCDVLNERECQELDEFEQVKFFLTQNKKWQIAHIKRSKDGISALRYSPRFNNASEKIRDEAYFVLRALVESRGFVKSSPYWLLQKKEFDFTAETTRRGTTYLGYWLSEPLPSDLFEVGQIELI